MTVSTIQQRFTLITTPAEDHAAEFARDVAAGLTRSPKRLTCRYFYDHEGSRLFEAICELPEYYLTRAEGDILREQAGEVMARIPHDTNLVELGSGSATKTRTLIEAILRRQERLRYLPVDISRTMLEESSLKLLDAYPMIEILAISAEYEEGLRQATSLVSGPKLTLWLGSNVGNFERPEASRFLQRVRDTMTFEDRLLVGIDLRKSRKILESAYDDSRGVTAQFNLNLLARINRELGGHFDLKAFRHRATYNEQAGRVEMYLVSQRAQRVAIDRLELEIEFAAGETLHTENSYKYSLSEIEALAATADLGIEGQWFDRDRRFSVNLLASTDS